MSGHPQSPGRAGARLCGLALQNSRLVRIMAGRTGDLAFEGEGKRYRLRTFGFLHDPAGFFARPSLKVLLKKISGHGGVASPAEKGDVGLEGYLFRSAVPARLLQMAQKAYRGPSDLSDRTVRLEHAVRIDRGVGLGEMAAEADIPPVGIGTSPEKLVRLLEPGSGMGDMAGEAGDLTVKERKGAYRNI
jgi:hypothetical protein